MLVVKSSDKYEEEIESAYQRGVRDATDDRVKYDTDKNAMLTDLRRQILNAENERKYSRHKDADLSYIEVRLVERLTPPRKQINHGINWGNMANIKKRVEYEAPLYRVQYRMSGEIESEVTLRIDDPDFSMRDVRAIIAEKLEEAKRI